MIKLEDNGLLVRVVESGGRFFTDGKMTDRDPITVLEFKRGEDTVRLRTDSGPLLGADNSTDVPLDMIQYILLLAGH